MIGRQVAAKTLQLWRLNRLSLLRLRRNCFSISIIANCATVIVITVVRMTGAARKPVSDLAGDKAPDQSFPVSETIIPAT